MKETCITKFLDDVLLRPALGRDMPIIYSYPNLSNLPPPRHWYVATFLESMIGAIGFTILGTACHINYIYVEPKYRGSEVDKSLLYQVENTVSGCKFLVYKVPLLIEYKKEWEFAVAHFQNVATHHDHVLFIRRRNDLVNRQYYNSAAITG